MSESLKNAILAGIAASQGTALTPPNTSNPSDVTTEPKLTKKEKNALARGVKAIVEADKFMAKHLSAEQRDGMVEIGVLCADEADHRLTFRQSMIPLAAVVFPTAKSVVYDTVRYLTSWIEYYNGAHAVTVWREVAKARFAEFDLKWPTKGDKRAKGGTKGLSPARASQGLDTWGQGYIDRALRLKGIVTPATMDLLRAASEAVRRANVAMRREAKAKR